MTASGSERRVYPQPDIVIERLDDCERCGAQLWSRNGSGRYRITPLRFDDGPPVLEPHSALSCPNWFGEHHRTTLVDEIARTLDLNAGLADVLRRMKE